MMDLIKKGFWILAFLLIPTTISAQDSVHVNLDKAIEIYEKLSLLFPEKSIPEPLCQGGSGLEGEPQGTPPFRI